jgi:hypothetical protein
MEWSGETVRTGTGPSPEGGSPLAEANTVGSSPAAETAWRIHGGLLDWTGKIDSKASFVLTVEAAALAGFAVLGHPWRELAHGVGAFQRLAGLAGS